MTLHLNIRNAIKARIETVPDAGIVHTFERFDKGREHMKKFFILEGTQTIKTWLIRRKAWEETVVVPDVRVNVATEWEIRTYLGWEDEQQSELLFDDLLDTVAAAFRTDEFLCTGTELKTTNGRRGLQLINNEPVTLCAALCHGATFRLHTTSLVQLPQPDAPPPLTDAKVGFAPNVGEAHREDYKDLVNG